MQETIRALLELHEVNRQRQVLIEERKARERRLAEAQRTLAEKTAAREAAEQEREGLAALVRQYTADKERCEETIARLREQQMQARSNKEYLACINGIEGAKAELKLRENSLAELGERRDELDRRVAAATTAEEEARAAVEAVERDIAAHEEQGASEQELDRIYGEKKRAVDPKFLETYERLVQARHPMPLMRVDARTRATPMGNVINTSAAEQLRLGHLVVDSVSNAILYIDD